MQYRTRDGDTLDLICHNYYGTTDAVETVLEANSGLAELGEVYNAGLIIVLPSIEQQKYKTSVRLWD